MALQLREEGSRERLTKHQSTFKSSERGSRSRRRARSVRVCGLLIFYDVIHGPSMLSYHRQDVLMALHRHGDSLNFNFYSEVYYQYAIVCCSCGNSHGMNIR